MIQTEVKKLAEDEHAVHVRIPQEEYNRVYSSQLGALSSTLKLPGFRSGRTPKKMIEERFTEKLREDTLSALMKSHYATAIEESKLAPAMQPTVELPESQPDSGFEFILNVVTWPTVEIADLDKLSVTELRVDVSDADVESVITRLFKTRVNYVDDGKKKAESGDQLVIDFTGSIDGIPFEGGAGEDVLLVLGEGKFIPDLEHGLIGAVAGDERKVPVKFPETYQPPLAGKQASFDVQVKNVAVAAEAEDEAELAAIMRFDDAAAMRADIRKRLEQEAEQAADVSTSRSVFNELLEACQIQIPEPLVDQEMRDSVRRIVKSSRERGQEADPALFEDRRFQSELRARSERNIKLSLLINAMQNQLGLEITADDEDEELDRSAHQYPEDQRDGFKAWFRQQKEQMGGMRDHILEKKCMALILAKASVRQELMTLSDWQTSQDGPVSEDSAEQPVMEAA